MHFLSNRPRLSWWLTHIFYSCCVLLCLVFLCMNISKLYQLSEINLKSSGLSYFTRKMSDIVKPLDQIIDVDIDNGRFKYILIKIEDKDSSLKHIVRGYNWASYHKDILDKVKPGIRKLGLKCRCVGGGRIYHSPENKTIEVYGYSVGFGLADHQISVELLKKKYPNYKITWSNDGY